MGCPISKPKSSEPKLPASTISRQMAANDVSVVILCTSIRIFHKVTNPHEALLHCEKIHFIHSYRCTGRSRWSHAVNSSFTHSRSVQPSYRNRRISHIEA